MRYAELLQVSEALAQEISYSIDSVATTTGTSLVRPSSPVSARLATLGHPPLHHRLERHSRSLARGPWP
jgi:hypothetical protein